MSGLPDNAQGATSVRVLRLGGREQSMSTALAELGSARFSEADERGAAMSLVAAAEFAVMLTGPDSPVRKEPDTEASLLSAREQELVRLVAQGRTDAQIADQLFISIRTVGSHLDRIRDKTGCRRRADLTRLALELGLV